MSKGIIKVATELNAAERELAALQAKIPSSGTYYNKAKLELEREAAELRIQVASLQMNLLTLLKP